MQTPVSVDGFGNGGFYRGTVCHITRDEDRLPTRIADGVLDSLSFWFAAGQEGNVGTFLGETVRRRFPNATITPGDNGHFPLQPSWHIASFVR
jgi:hypothetical protein